MAEQRSRFTILPAVGFGLAFLAWTLLVPVLDGIDGWWRFDPPPAQHWLGQIGSAISFATASAVLYPVLLIAAWWASRRQLTALAASVVLSAALGFSSAVVVKHLVDRDRPESPWDYLVTQQGPAYPSSHVVAITAAVMVMLVLVTTARRGKATILAWRIAGPLLVLVVALDRLLMGANHVSDVVGGVLLGGFAVSLANLVCGVHEPRPAERREGAEGKKAAVIYNPTKVVDPTIFRGLIERRIEEEGWEPPIWLSTTADDPGYAMAKQAVDLGVDLVLVAGGDGTVRVVCGQLAGTGMDVAIVPSGTGNLLARNLDIPLDADRALGVAFEGDVAEIDVLKVQVPERDDDYAVVMCGVGADAALLNDTDEDLKNQIGVAAYVVAGLQHVKVNPVRTTVTIDDDEPFERDASLTMVANVSDLQAGLTLMPGATASDGILDVLVASPRNQGELAQMAAAVVAQSDAPDSLVRKTGRTVRIELGEPQMYELDGDVIGETSELCFEVQQGALRLRVPVAHHVHPRRGR